MNSAISNFIDQFALEQGSFALPATINDTIYKWKLKANQNGFMYPPKCMYFYYVRIEPEGTLTVRHYFWANVDPGNPNQWIPIDPAQLPVIIKDRAENARIQGNMPRADSSINFEDIIWKKKAYIVIFIDEDKWRLHKRGNRHGPIVFNLAEGSTPNHTFYDADDYIIKMPVPNNPTLEMDCTAVAFINHMKKEDGTDLIMGDGPTGDGSEFYHFDIFFEVSTTQGTDASMTVIIDPTGTNQGPPEADP